MPEQSDLGLSRTRFRGSLLGLAAGDALGTTGAVCGQLAGAFDGEAGILAGKTPDRRSIS